jgi:malic enzyme
VLLYRLLLDHITELIPMVYTPTVGAACQHFSHIYRRPRGPFLSYPHRDSLEEMLDHRPYRDVDVIVVTDGRALIATGSPFLPVAFQGRMFHVSQCNNSYIFAGLGLGIIASGARRVTDTMFLKAAYALEDCSPAHSDPHAPLFPPMEAIRIVSSRIA